MMKQVFLDVLSRAMRARQVAHSKADRELATSDAACPWQLDKQQPFTGVTSRFAGWLLEHAPVTRFGLVIKAGWHRRLLVIESVSEAAIVVSKPDHDIKGLTLALPGGTSAESIARECQRFGARVERWFRDHHRGEFDVTCGADDRGHAGMRHIVHRYHHVAVCHYRGPWPEEPIEREIASEIEMCPICCSMAREQPSYRARYHPLSLKPRPLAPLA